MSLVLIGLPASGKSSLGAALAERLGLVHLDTDALIEARTGQSIPDIFSQHGEAVFRQWEAEAVAWALAQPEAVVSLGGGAVCTAAVRQALAGHRVVWLDVSLRTAIRRAGLGGLRPLLQGDLRQRLAELERLRRPLYQALADHRVSGDGTHLGPLADRLVAELSRAGWPTAPADQTEAQVTDHA
ncbi:MAG: shikimate kinase [Propionibacteriaceae bacterium]|jgi:shikimate kinase|nr:shikimate kinase [Propionibacteriaceae bacterium]